MSPQPHSSPSPPTSPSASSASQPSHAQSLTSTLHSSGPHGKRREEGNLNADDAAAAASLGGHWGQQEEDGGDGTEQGEGQKRKIKERKEVEKETIASPEELSVPNAAAAASISPTFSASSSFDPPSPPRNTPAQPANFPSSSPSLNLVTLALSDCSLTSQLEKLDEKAGVEGGKPLIGLGFATQDVPSLASSSSFQSPSAPLTPSSARLQRPPTSLEVQERAIEGETSPEELKRGFLRRVAEGEFRSEGTVEGILEPGDFLLVEDKEGGVYFVTDPARLPNAQLGDLITYDAYHDKTTDALIALDARFKSTTSAKEEESEEVEEVVGE